MVEFYLLTFSRFPLRNQDNKRNKILIFSLENRTRDLRTTSGLRGYPYNSLLGRYIRKE